ncbi:RNA polymerase Rpb4 family protein [Methanoregula sp.]|uniref:RNA polymerase Rpb4 family protein n=1 Tax=Methanoregula sp. TaxID=2052170 RepID=UPI00356999A7
MKVKGIISEEKVTLPEMRGVLLGVESERIAAEKEMSYEFRRSIEHANQLAKTTPEKAEALVSDLIKMEKMKPEIAYRIANIMPKTRDEVRAIFAKERYTLSPEELDKIIETVMTRF